MAKVVFLTQQYLLDARYTADNLLVAKLMSDRGMPLNGELPFYVNTSYYESPLFYEAMNQLFMIQSKEVEEEKIEILITNELILRWSNLYESIKQSSINEAFRMVQKGLESTLNETKFSFDTTMSGEFTKNGVQLKIKGPGEDVLFYEVLEKLLQFQDELKQQLTIWEDNYEQFTGSERNAYHAS